MNGDVKKAGAREEERIIRQKLAALASRARKRAAGVVREFTRIDREADARKREVLRRAEVISREEGRVLEALLRRAKSLKT